VTAEKRSAIPLAQVTFNLLESLEHFPTIFFAKLVQRCGGWPIPFVVPQVDLDGNPGILKIFIAKFAASGRVKVERG
jgi:nucleoporin GLE1